MQVRVLAILCCVLVCAWCCKSSAQAFPVVWCQVEHLRDLLAEEVNWVWEPFGCLEVGRAEPAALM